MTFELLHGPCDKLMWLFDDDSMDSIVTDPPYELGFMGKHWDKSGIANSVDLWREALRVLKPGGYLLAFSSSRTYHRMVCAIEDAGFEIRDQIMWLYGSGFPKSHNLEGDWAGWGTALKPAHEPICVARKPLAKGNTVASNVLAFGTGALNIDGCRVETTENLNGGGYTPRAAGNGWEETGGMNKAGACADRPFEQPDGRWPANVTHDGSDEVVEAFPDAKGQQGALTGSEPSSKTLNTFGAYAGRAPSEPRTEIETSAARFFYCAKASKADRGEGNNHPTVKPTALMRYLCRLVTPPGGTVLDLFVGSGSTGKAAVLEGFNFVGIDQDADYVALSKQRIEQAAA